MIYLALYVAYAAALWCFTWLVYLSDCAVRHAGAKATWPSRVISPLAAACSTLLNVTVFTLVLLELPQPGEAFLSSRLSRHKRLGSGWRQRLADKLGRVWLDPYDPTGAHI